eukprot:gene67-4316_t
MELVEILRKREQFLTTQIKATPVILFTFVLVSLVSYVISGFEPMLIFLFFTELITQYTLSKWGVEYSYFWVVLRCLIKLMIYPIHLKYTHKHFFWILVEVHVLQLGPNFYDADFFAHFFTYTNVIFCIFVNQFYYQNDFAFTFTVAVNTLFQHHIFHIFKNVLLKKNLELEKRVSEFESVLESIQSHVFKTDLNLDILLINKEFLGKNEKYLVGSSFKNLPIFHNEKFSELHRSKKTQVYKIQVSHDSQNYLYMVTTIYDSLPLSHFKTIVLVLQDEDISDDLTKLLHGMNTKNICVTKSKEKISTVFKETPDCKIFVDDDLIYQIPAKIPHDQVVIIGNSSKKHSEYNDCLRLFKPILSSDLILELSPTLKKKFSGDWNLLEGSNVLIVEDHVVIQKCIKKFIEKMSPKKVFVADNGEEALKIYKQEISIDLIITDINMPLMNGFDLVKSIKSFNASTNTKIIVATGELNNQMLREFVKQWKIDDTLLKPITYKSLITSIRKMAVLGLQGSVYWTVFRCILKLLSYVTHVLYAHEDFFWVIIEVHLVQINPNFMDHSIIITLALTLTFIYQHFILMTFKDVYAENTTLLEQQLSEYQSVLLSIKSHVIKTDLNFNILLINKGFLGKSVDNLIGSNFKNLPIFDEEKFHNFIKTKKTETHKIQVIHEGKTFLFLVAVSPIWMNGEMVGMTILCTDSTYELEIKQKKIDALKINIPQATKKSLDFTYSIDYQIPRMIKGDMILVLQDNEISSEMNKILDGMNATNVCITKSKEKISKTYENNSDCKIFVDDDLIYQIPSNIPQDKIRIIGNSSKENSEYNDCLRIFKPILPSHLILELTPTMKKKFSGEENLLEGAIVLIVEDHIVIQKCLKKMIQKMNPLKILVAENGEQGLNHYQNENRIDLILTDINMPVMNGFELIKSIRKLKKLYDSKFVVTTGELNIQKLGDFIKEWNVDDILLKPITYKSLITSIRNTFSE